MNVILASVVETERREFELAGMPAGWTRLAGLVLIIALCGAVVWMYRREGRTGGSRRARVVMATLRCLVVVLLAVVWLEPVIATYTIRTIAARVAVLVDVSASMWITDVGVDGPTVPAASTATVAARAQRVEVLLSGSDCAWLRRLAARNDLAMYVFGEQARRAVLPWDPPPTGVAAQSAPAPEDEQGPPLTPLSLGAAPLTLRNRTDAGQAVARALDDAGESPIAGIVLLSDGGINKGMSADEIAAYARRRKAPVFAVGVGAPREPPNVRVVNVVGPASTPRGDPFEIRVELAAAGIDPTEVEVELTAEPVGDVHRLKTGATEELDVHRLKTGATEELDVHRLKTGATEQAAGDHTARKVVAARRTPLSVDAPAAPILFRVSPGEGGEYVYRARVEPLPIEAVTDDNAGEAYVQVLDESLRVLVVAGRPSFDYRALTRLLERDKTVDLSCWLQSADARAVRDGDTVVTELPRQPEELFAYDAIFLMDPNPGELDSSWAITVRRWVDELGGGLLLQAGSHYTTRFLTDPRLQELAAILPVTPDPEADVQLSEQGAFRGRAYSLELPAKSRGHPLVTLHGDPATNQSIWSALGGVWWYLPVQRAKPVATVLLQHSGAAQRNRYGPAVLLAVQPMGAGRTAFLGFGDTWRWRSTGEQHFNQFWVQMVRYLAQTRRQGGSKRGTVTVDNESVDIGEYVKIEARVLDEEFAPWQEPQIEAVVELSDGARRTVTLGAIAGREGWFGGRVMLDRDGPALIRVPLPRARRAGEPGAAEESLVKHIRVRRPDYELRALRLDEENLQRLAQQTGGLYVPLAEADQLPERIERASRMEVPRRTEMPVWDRGWVLAGLAALLSVEWALRRRNHLL